MKNPTYLIASLVGALLIPTVAQATLVEITRSDYGAGTVFGAGHTLPGTWQEDQETEPGSQASQVWDMEAFLLDTTANKLFIVAGYDLINGVAYAGGPAPGNPDNRITPGDVFIKVGGTQPASSPTSTGSGNVANSTYGYNFAIDLSLHNGTTYVPQTFGSTANVFTLGANTQLNTGLWDSFQANPWKYANDGSALGVTTTAINYSVFSTDAALTAYLNAIDPAFLTPGNTFKGGWHNVLEIDLGFLSLPANQTMWLSYTMECGNDSLKGSYIPDRAVSALLIALGLLGTFVATRKTRRSV